VRDCSHEDVSGIDRKQKYPKIALKLSLYFLDENTAICYNRKTRKEVIQ